MERNWLDIVALILIIIGAINWGLIGFFRLPVFSDNYQQSAGLFMPSSA